MKLAALRNFYLAVAIHFPLYPASAWSEHALGVYPALEVSEKLARQRDIPAEDLSNFLLRNEKKLETLLQQEENWAQSNLIHYAPLPADLRFVANGDKNTIVARFARAIRIHPGLLLQPYIQADPRTGCGKRPPLVPKQTVFKDNSAFLKIQFCRLKAGDYIHPLLVIATAADEPDHGLDIGLFQDNNTAHGAQYGFGPQPFGDPRLEYGSQAPFHMGFYHESSIVYAGAPFLRQTYPEYRIRLYRQLGIFALREGHPYWGYRFLGWGLHYLTDLTQPYHATVLPGVSTLKMLWVNILALLGFPSAKENAVNLVSNRHTAIEELQWHLLREEMHNPQTGELVAAFADLGSDREYPTYSDSYPREIIAREANSRAAEADELLVEALPEQYVSDPTFTYTAADKEQLLTATRSYNREGYSALRQYLKTLFRSFGAHSRIYIESALAAAGS